jgi:hypothetical protein
MKIKRTDITIETARVIVISTPKRMIAWCGGCNKDVDWVTLDEAARLAKTSSRQVIRLIEGGDLHSAETLEGILLVCPDSLIQAKPGDERQEAQSREIES